MGLLGADSGLPAGALIALIVLGVVEIGLVVYCIIDIVRRPAVLGGHKWLWIFLVLVFNLVGSIVYLAVGREQPAAEEPARAGDLDARSRTESAADLLYGPAATREPPSTADDGPASGGASKGAATSAGDGPA
jgi:hypothetical protein